MISMDLNFLGEEEEEGEKVLPDKEDTMEKLEKNEASNDLDQQSKEQLAEYFQQSLNVAMGAGRKESTLRESEEGEDKVLQAVMLVGFISFANVAITLLQLQGVI